MNFNDGTYGFICNGFINHWFQVTTTLWWQDTEYNGLGKNGFVDIHTS